MGLEFDVEKEYFVSSLNKFVNSDSSFTGKTIKYVAKKTKSTVAAAKRYPSNLRKFMPQSLFSALFLSGVKVPVEMFVMPDFTIQDNASMTLALSALALFTFPVGFDIIQKPVKSATTYVKNIPITEKTRNIGRLGLAFVGTLGAKVGIYSGYFDHPLEESLLTGLVVAGGVTYLTDMIPKFYENPLLRNRLIGLSLLSIGVTYGVNIDRYDSIQKDSLNQQSHVEYKLDSVNKSNLLLESNQSKVSKTFHFAPLNDK